MQHRSGEQLVLPSLHGRSAMSALNRSPPDRRDSGSRARCSTPKATHRRRKTVHTLDRLRSTTRELGNDTGLRSELDSLYLNEHYDKRGSPFFQHLGLTFTAKQHLSKQSFGSTALYQPPVQAPKRNETAKAYFLASVSLEKELQDRQKRSAEHSASLSAAERLRADDVHCRQTSMLFNCHADAEKYLPPGISMADLLPPDMNHHDEARERRAAEKANAHVTDHRWRMGSVMQWLFNRNEIQPLLNIVALWTKASHGMLISIGMDRPTFCRFILDLGLVDQVQVPFYWCVSLFDEAAQILRPLPPDAVTVRPILLQPMVNQWRLLAILDTILRKCFSGKDGKDGKAQFFASLFPIAKLRLPAWVMDESDLDEEMYVNVSSAPTSTDSGERDPAVPIWRTMCEPVESLTERDLQKELHVQEFRVRAMMVEPEVLHMLAKYRALFSSLHACYSDTDGHMSLQLFHQFSNDFHIIPVVVSSHSVTKFYTSAESLLPSRVDGPVVREPRSMSPKRLFKVSDVRTSGRRGKRGSRHPVPAKYGSNSKQAGSPRSHLGVQGHGHEEERKLRGSLSDASTSDLGQNGTCEPLREMPWAPVVAHARSSIVPKAAASEDEEHSGRVPPVFGVSAFTESLCRIVFVFLGSSGNVVQQGTSGFTRVVWLLTFLRRVFVHYKERLQSRSERGENLHGCMTDALTRISEELWLSPRWVEVPLLAPTTMRTSLYCRSDLNLELDRRLGKRGGYWALSEMSFVDDEPPPAGAGALERRGGILVSQSKAPKERLNQRGSVTLVLDPLPSTDDSPLSDKHVVDGRSVGERRTVGVVSTEVLMSITDTGDDDHGDRRSARSESSSDDSDVGAFDDAPARPLSANLGSQQLAIESAQKASDRTLVPDWKKQRHQQLELQHQHDECIVDGICTMCGSSAGHAQWGDVACRGCSIVDILPFEHHILRPLLKDSMFGAQPEVPPTEFVFTTERRVLTPPTDVGCRDWIRS